MRQARLTAIDLPDFGSPTVEPVLDRGLYAARLGRLMARMAAHRLDALVIFGDREHVANICWATGYDPRFEEAIGIVVPGRPPTLLLGNEGFPYAETANGGFERVLWQPLSLMGQPRDKSRALNDVLRESGLKPAMRIGLAGWKGFESPDGIFDPDWFETPAYLVEALRKFGHVENAAQLFMNCVDGLRVINEVEQLACFEYASALSSSALARLIRGTRPGMTEYQSVSLLAQNGFPQSVHVNMCAGPRAKYGLPSPSMRLIQHGDPIVAGHGLMGALNCRAGFMVASASELPAHIADYIEKLVAPYFEAAAAWYETLGLGVEAGALHDAVMSRLGDPFFGIGLNPGHFIHLDEWVNSPVKKHGQVKFTSGMALQCDIIPATGTDYFTTNIEDGVGLLDNGGRTAFKAKYPQAWSRIEARRSFMKDQLGINLKPEVLPFSNIPAWLPPFWLAPENVMAQRWSSVH